MAVTEQRTDAQLQGMLLNDLQSGKKYRRKELLEACLSDMGIDVNGDNSPGSPLTLAKSHLGSVLTELLRSGTAYEDDAGFLCLAQPENRQFSGIEVRQFLLDTLAGGAVLGKNRLFTLAEQRFGTDKTPGRKDDNALRSVVGRILLDLEKENHVAKTSRGYRLRTNGSYPMTELGGILQKAAGGGDLQDCFLEAIHCKGGEWFEAYCVSLLRAYFIRMGKTVDEGFVTGGSNDGGIDGVIHTTDDLGYRETILMQMKNRHVTMNPKDVREFYGAVCAENGSRGVFVTISGFHPEAWKFMERIDNLTGIDGKKLFEIASKCQLGLVMKDGRLVMDEDLFLKD